MTGELCRILWTTKVFLYKFHKGYHHIDIDENHPKYLGFSCKIDGKISCFLLTVLRFVLRFTHLFLRRPYAILQKFWRKEGTKIPVYIDDGFGHPLPPPPPSIDLAMEEAEFLRNSFT